MNAAELIRSLTQWAMIKLEIAQQNTGPVDDYEYQRDQGKIEVLQDLLEQLTQ